MSDTKEAYESGKAVGRCQGAREMELAIALDNKAASLRINQQPQPKMPSDSDWYDFACSIGIAPYEAQLAYKWFACHFGRVR